MSVVCVTNKLYRNKRNFTFHVKCPVLDNNMGPGQDDARHFPEMFNNLLLPVFGSSNYTIAPHLKLNSLFKMSRNYRIAEDSIEHYLILVSDYTSP